MLTDVPEDVESSHDSQEEHVVLEIQAMVDEPQPNPDATDQLMLIECSQPAHIKPTQAAVRTSSTGVAAYQMIC